jgi:peptidyl-prolyl cis-trans isomerase B (cyclophilin B)
MITALIILGLFAVYVFNEQTTKPAEQTIANFLNPSPAPTQALNINSPKTSSPSSQTPTITSQAEASTAIIETSKGNIELTLYPKDAPMTVANFVSKAKSGFYTNKIFHRVEDWVIQGGDPLGNGTGGGKMSTELNNKPFVIGSLGVARGQDINISNDAQFFITKTDASWLNGQYTNFGIVIKGMDVVNKMEIGDKILGITTQ